MRIPCQKVVQTLLTLCLFGLAQACTTDGEVAGTPYNLPDSISELSPETQETLRAVFTIDGVVGPVTMSIDAASATASGQYVLPNEAVENASIHIELYGALNANTEEVLLGSVASTISIEPGKYNAANLPEMTTAGELYDANRNGASNLEDLKALIDPAPMNNPLDISPDTISFDSGVEVGGFTRSFFVIENNGNENVSMDMAVQLAPGISIAPLEAIFELGSAAPNDNFTLDLAPGEEQVMSVTFAPSDALFLAGALSVNSTTETSNVSHGLMMRLIGNPEGAVPQPPSSYSIPDPSGIALDGYTGSFQAYGVNQLFSREPFNPANLTEQNSGAIAGQDIDDAYLVMVPKGYRFSLTLDGLTDDVDLFLFDSTATLDAEGNLASLTLNDYNPTSEQDRCTPNLTLNTVDCSTNVGSSPESISYDGTQQTESYRYLIVALDARESPALGDTEQTGDNQENTSAQPLTDNSLQGAGMQAAMYNRPDIELIESSRLCPNIKYGQAVCTNADGNAVLTIYGVNFEPGITAQVSWRDIATGQEVSVFTACGEPQENQPITQPVRDAEGNVIDSRTMVLDMLQCDTPAAIVNPQVGPKANLILTNPNGAVAVKPEAITYLPPEPEINRIFPASGPTTGGTTLTVYGNNFYELNGRQPVVALGDYPTEQIGTDDQPTDSDAENSFVMVTVRDVSEDGREMVVELPACDGCETTTPHALTVINPDLQFTKEGSLFTYVRPAGPGPLLSGVEPAQGSVEGGNVHLYGSNFFDIDGQPLTTISVDNREVTNFTVYASGSAECPESIGDEYDCVALAIPAHEPGSVAVEVTNAENQTSRLASGYVYRFPNPVLSTIYPDMGSTAGGLPITLSGNFFQPGARVFFGEFEAPLVTFTSTNAVTAVTPGGTSPGTTSVRVEHSDGTATTLEQAFTYIDPAPAPEIASIQPNTGYTVGGDTVSILGSNFQNGAKVFFGNTTAPQVTFVSENELQASTPARAGAELTSIRVENPDMNSVTVPNAFAYTIAPPSIAAIDPGFAPVETNTTVFISGTGFQDGAVVTFGDIPASSTTVNSSTLILASTPSVENSGSVNVVITNPDNQVATYPGFAFAEGLLPPPRIISVSPASTSPTGGTVTITGQGIGFGTSVFFGDTEVTPEDYTTDPLTGDPQIIVYAPSHPAGDVLLRVQNEDGQADATNFTYAEPVGLAVNSIVPGRGDFDLVTPALIVGNGFTESATVTLEVAQGTLKNPDETCKDLDEEEEADFDYNLNCTEELIPTFISDSVLSVNIPASCVSLIDSCINLSELSMTVTIQQGNETTQPLNNAFLYEVPAGFGGPNGSISVFPVGQGSPCGEPGGVAISMNDEPPTYVCNGTNGVDGSNGTDGQDGTPGTDGREIAVIPTPIQAGNQPCVETGGTNISIGFYEDGSFVELTSYDVCNGAAGSDGADGAPGETGPEGNPGDQGNPGENGISTIITVDDSGNCPVFKVGLDGNGDGVLDSPEITSETTVCDGATGSDGAPGENGTNGSDGADGIRTMATMENLAAGDTNCPYGGTIITIWVDTNENAIADLEESPISNYACNGYGWDLNPANAPTVSHTFPTSLYADYGGLVGITGTNFSPTDTRVVISGQTLTPVAAQSTSTYLVVDFPIAPQQTAASSATGDLWGNTSVNFEVVNTNGQTASGSIYYEAAACFDRGDSYCPENYACTAFDPSGETPCVWACDADSTLDYPEQCNTQTTGWRTTCGGSTLCASRPALSGSPIALLNAAAAAVSFGGEDANGLTSDLWQGRQPPGHSWSLNLSTNFIWEPVCTSTSCLDSKPTARAHHSLVVAANAETYIFGGILADGTYSDEMWRMTFDNGIWGWELVCGGDSGCSGPSGRERAIMFNDSANLVVFGGRNDGGILGDTWQFNVQSNSWQDISCQQGNCPTARFSAAVDTHSDYNDGNDNTFVYMGGGETDAGLSNEIWTARVDGEPQIQWELICGGASGCAGLPPRKDGLLVFKKDGLNSNATSLLYHGGADDAGNISDHTYELQIILSEVAFPNGNWVQICGSGTGCTGQAVAEASGGYTGSYRELFVIGGKSPTGIQDDFLILNFDGVATNGKTCGQFGFVAGNMGCSDCTLDTSGCMARPNSCGNGTVEAQYGEECEPSTFVENFCLMSGLGSGKIACGSNCRLDYSGCSLPYQCGSGSLDHPQKACDQQATVFSSCTDFWTNVGDGQRVASIESSSALSCESSCAPGFTNCSVKPCGNGDIDIAFKNNLVYYQEACDPGGNGAPVNLGGLSCNDFGQVGTLACAASDESNACEYNLSGCSAPAASCSNGAQDGNESALDCGGNSCLPCADGQACGGDSDCISKNCGQNGTCAASSFSNSKTDGNETDQDCGGPDVSGESQRCELGSDCFVDMDCGDPTGDFQPAQGFDRDVLCKARKCVLATGVSGCSSNAECFSGFCNGSSVCQNPNTVIGGGGGID